MRPSYRPFLALAVLVMLAAPPGAAQAVINKSNLKISTQSAGSVTITVGDGCNAFITPFTPDGQKSMTDVQPASSLAVTSQSFSIRASKAGSTRLGFRVIGEDAALGTGGDCTSVEEVFVDIIILDGKVVESQYKSAIKAPMSDIKAVTSTKSKEIDAGLKALAASMNGNPLASGMTATIDGTNVVIQALDDVDKTTRAALNQLQGAGNAILAANQFSQDLMPAGLQHGGGGEHDAMLASIDKLYDSMWSRIEKSWSKFELQVEQTSRETDNPVQINSVLRELELPMVNGPWAPDSSPPASPPEAFQLPLVVAVSQQVGTGRMLLRGLAQQDLDDIYEVRLGGPQGSYTEVGVSFISGSGLWTLGIPGLEYPGNYNVNIARNLDPVLMPVDVINVAYPASP